MKVKTTIALSQALIEAIDKRARRLRKNRSELIETAIASFVDQIERQEISARDIAVIDGNANELNEEAEDVLLFLALR